MKHFKTLIAGACLMFTFLSNTASATKLTVALKYQGRPLCGWNVTLYMHGGDDWSHAVSDANGIVEFPNLPAIKEGLDIKGVKNTKEGEKRWRFMDFIQYDKSVDFGGMNGTYDDTYVTLNCEKLVVEQYGQKLSNVEESWGFAPADNDCSTSTNQNQQAGSGDKLTDDIKDMRDLQREMAADRKEDLETQNNALKQKIERLKQRVAKTKEEQSALTPGTLDHSNKSYDLRDLEIEHDLAELELDRNLDEQSRMGQGQLSKSDRQRYSDKMDALTAEQKQLAKNKKDGLMYGQAPLSKAEKEAAEKKAKEEKEAREEAERKAKEEEDNMPIKIFTPEELANMSAFDLKKTKMANSNGINRRKVKLKTKGAFLTEDVKARLNQQITDLEKQIEAIRAVLAQRNEKED